MLLTTCLIVYRTCLLWFSPWSRPYMFTFHKLPCFCTLCRLTSAPRVIMAWPVSLRPTLLLNPLYLPWFIDPTDLIIVGAHKQTSLLQFVYTHYSMRMFLSSRQRIQGCSCCHCSFLVQPPLELLILQPVVGGV